MTEALSFDWLMELIDAACLLNVGQKQNIDFSSNAGSFPPVHVHLQPIQCSIILTYIFVRYRI